MQCLYLKFETSESQFLNWVWRDWFAAHIAKKFYTDEKSLFEVFFHEWNDEMNFSNSYTSVSKRISFANLLPSWWCQICAHSIVHLRNLYLGMTPKTQDIILMFTLRLWAKNWKTVQKVLKSYFLLSILSVYRAFSLILYYF